MNAEPITPAHIESKLREVQRGVQGKIDDRKQSIIAVAGGIALVLLIIAYLLGRRGGKKKTTFVEIRRV
jgi:hypothetical protein